MIKVDELSAAHRSAARARAWTLGHRFAELLQEHEVPRPEQVYSDAFTTGRIAGYTELTARMASAADVFRLARKSGAELNLCPGAGDDREQAYMYVGGWPAQIAVHWAGTVSGAES